MDGLPALVSVTLQDREAGWTEQYIAALAEYRRLTHILARGV